MEIKTSCYPQIDRQRILERQKTAEAGKKWIQSSEGKSALNSAQKEAAKVIPQLQTASRSIAQLLRERRS